MVVVEITADSALEFGLVQDGLGGREENVKRSEDVGDSRVGEGQTQAGPPKRAPRKWLSLPQFDSSLSVGLLLTAGLGVAVAIFTAVPPSEWGAPVSQGTAQIVLSVLSVAGLSVAVTLVTLFNQMRESTRGPSSAIRELVWYARREWDARSYQPMDRP